MLQIAVVNRPVERIVGVERQPQGCRHERTYRRVSDYQRFLRHHIEPVAGVFVAALEVQQFGRDLCAVSGSAHQNHDVRRTESAIQQFTDALYHRRFFGERLDRYVACCRGFSAGSLGMAGIGVR